MFHIDKKLSDQNILQRTLNNFRVSRSKVKRSVSKRKLREHW